MDSPIPNSNTQQGSFVKPTEVLPEQAQVFSKAGTNNGLGASFKAGDYVIGRGKDSKGVVHPVERQFKGVRLKCVKVFRITAPAHPKPMFMFRSVYPP